MIMVRQVHTYADLRKQIHDDLRIQPPDWIQPNGESPMCDCCRGAPAGSAERPSTKWRR